MTTAALLLGFLIYWVILFAACFVLVEFAQNYLYDETTPSVGLKVAAGSFVLAALLAWTRPSFDTMFTTGAGSTVLSAIAGFAVFTLIFRFQPLHGAVLGVVSMLIISGIASIAVDSLTNPGRPTLPPVTRPNPPIRRSMTPAITPNPAPTDATKAEEPSETKN